MKGRKLISSTLRLALILAVICGVVYPIMVTGLGQAIFPYQANGDLAHLGNTTIGSYLIGQSTNNSHYLFNVRNDSASGVDPDITVASALAQAQVIHNNTRYSMFFFGTAYVDSLSLNIQIINHFHNSVPVYGKIYNRMNKPLS